MTQLNTRNAKTYKPRSGAIKIAVLCDEPATFEKPSWGAGGKQSFPGAFMLVMIPRNKGVPDGYGNKPYDVYGADVARFMAEHDPVPGVENGYVKKVRVLAVLLTGDTEVLTMVDGKLEASTTAPAGHYLVQQPKGEQQAIAPDQFAQLYELAE